LDADALGVYPVPCVVEEAKFIDKVVPSRLGAGPCFGGAATVSSRVVIAATIGLAVGDDVYRLHQIGVELILDLVVNE